MSTPASRVKQLREHLGYKPIDFAALIGITQSTLYRIEDETTTPRESTLIKIAEKTGADKDWLLFNKGKLSIIPPEKIPDTKDIIIKELRDRVASLEKIINDLTKKL